VTPARATTQLLRVTVDGSLTYEFDPEDLAAGESRDGSTPPAQATKTGRELRDAQAVLALPPVPDDRGAGRRRYEVVVDGWRFEVAVEPAARAALRDRARRAGEARGPSARQLVRAQIPGRVVAVFVSPGDRVEAGDRLVSVEAMKMENEVRAPRAGNIERVGVTPGGRVELGDELVVIE
jgi:biotin carboxyl carrier protein